MLTIYVKSNSNYQTLQISNVVGNSFIGQNKNIKVELLCLDSPYQMEDSCVPTILEIPEYVIKIETNVFSGISRITFKVAVTQKPVGWADGWNDDCRVEWGADIQTKRRFAKYCCERSMTKNMVLWVRKTACRKSSWNLW